jgi:small subunit ribosomal protein S15
MYLTKEIKEEIFAQHGEKTNTGKTEGQIALFTFRITHLTEHLKKIVTIIQSVH